MQAVVCERWGDPDEVLDVRETPMPEPQAGEVRIRMLASPVNPSDVLMIRGEYGRQPPLPATPGFEGVGIVEAGTGLLARRVLGRRVAVLGGGTWREHVVVPVRQAVPVPKELSDEQAASFFVNPATALIMTRYVLRVPRGAWLLQTAAGSALGRMVIRLGQYYGFKTLNVVRRQEQAEELRRAGGTATIATDTEPLLERARDLTAGEGVRFAIDAVGGATGSAVIGALGRHAHVLVYGRLAAAPLEIDPGTLLMGQKRVEGFWLSEWAQDQNALTMLMLFRRLGRLIADGVLATETGPSFPLTQVKEAVRLSTAPGHHGKICLRIGSR